MEEDYDFRDGDCFYLSDFEEDSNHVLELDDRIYASDFEEDLEYIVGVEEFLQGTHEGGGALASTSTLEGAYFQHSDSESENEGDEEDGGGLHEVGNEHADCATDNLREFLDEPSLPSFEDVPIETFPKYVHFTRTSKQLMIHCLKEGIFPTFDQIREVDISFRPLAKLHGRSIDANDAFHTTKRWEKLQEKLKLVECIDGIALSPMSDTKDRLIPPIEHWCSIVQNSHVDGGGKHLSPTSTFSALREKWSTDSKVGGILASFVESCLQSCQICKHAKFWDEVHQVPLEHLHVTLDAICTKHIVL
jgi:hypothetical protein